MGSLDFGWAVSRRRAFNDARISVEPDNEYGGPDGLRASREAFSASFQPKSECPFRTEGVNAAATYAANSSGRSEVPGPGWLRGDCPRFDDGRSVVVRRARSAQIRMILPSECVFYPGTGMTASCDGVTPRSLATCSCRRRATTPPHPESSQLATELGADRHRIRVDETLGEGDFRIGGLMTCVTHDDLMGREKARPLHSAWPCPLLIAGISHRIPMRQMPSNPGASRIKLDGSGTVHAPISKCFQRSK